MVGLSITLGPTSRTPGPNRQIIVPPNMMESTLHSPLYEPLCNTLGPPPPLPDGKPACRRNTAERDLLLFYQGSHADNSFRDLALNELQSSVFGDSTCPCGHMQLLPCNCFEKPWCCVNKREGTAYFSVGSHRAPNAHLDWAKTIAYMQRSRFCLCPGGDTPYTKRFFLAITSGCVPVVFSFRSYEGDAPRTNWWKEGGPVTEDLYPFTRSINYSELVVEVNSSRVNGFIDELRTVPPEVVEEKQRNLERVRHHFLYNPAGTSEDAFTMTLHELIRVLAEIGV